MKYIKINYREIFLITLLLLPEQLLYFVNRNTFKQILHIEYVDFVFGIYFILFIYVFIHYKISDFQKYFFASNFIMILPLVVMASIVPVILFDQSVIKGFMAQRAFLMQIFSYYIVRTAIIKKNVSIEHLWDCMYRLSFVFTAVFIVQHAIINYVQILDVSYTRRFGVRITANYTYSTILLIGSLILFFNSSNGKEKKVAIIGLIMAYYHCILISQTRIVMVAYGALTIFMAVFFRNRVIKKIIYALIICVFMILIMQSNLGNYLLTAVSDSSSDPSAQIREIGKAYYIRKISESPLVGSGYPTNYEALKASGYYEHIGLNDNGVVAFAYIYGLLGVVWYLHITVKMIICSIKAAQKGEFRFMLYTLFIQIICLNIIWWYFSFSFGLVFTIMLALMEEYKVSNTERKSRFYFGQ